MSESGTPHSAVQSGEILAGRYQLERLIGKGGMAEVWSARDDGLDRRVAVKWLKQSLAGDEVIAERFRREALAVAKLSHPNIVAIHDVIEHQGRQAVVMQLVDGKSLRVHLDKQKRLGPELTIHLGASVAAALDCAHRANLVHRDVKPGNILLATDGRALLTDFGIAKALDGNEEDLTSDNVMMGTAKYLSPEQVRGKPLDGRADLYALGLVLYECLAGRVPFLGENDADTALARLQRDPTDLGHLRPTLPIGLVNLIHKTLARNPAHRPQTGAEFRSALMAVDTDPPEIDHTPTELPDRQRNPPDRALGAGPGAPGAPAEPPAPAASGTADKNRRRRARRKNPSSKSSPPAGTGVVPDAAPADAKATSPAEPAVQPSNRRPDAAAQRGSEASRSPAEPLLNPARKDFSDQAQDLSGSLQQRLGPTRAVLLAVSAVAVLVLVGLLAINNRGEKDPGLPSKSAATTAPPLAPGAGPVTVGATKAFDPHGDNGTENDRQTPLALADQQRSTFWATECYQNEYLSGKPGVGLIVSLTNPGTGKLQFDAISAPHKMTVYVAPSDTVPTSLDGWNVASAVFSDEEPQTIEVEITKPARHLLIWVTQLAQDEACTSTNPYRAKIGEVSFTAG